MPLAFSKPIAGCIFSNCDATERLVQQDLCSEYELTMDFEKAGFHVLILEIPSRY